MNAAAPGQAAPPVRQLQDQVPGSPQASQCASAQRGGERTALLEKKAAPLGKVISPQTGSQRLSRFRMAPRDTLEAGAATHFPTAAVLLGKTRSTRVHTRRDHLPAGGSGNAGPLTTPKSQRTLPSRPLRNQASSHHCPHLPGRAAHLCAGTRRCSPRWTSARPLGPAAGC